MRTKISSLNLPNFNTLKLKAKKLPKRSSFFIFKYLMN